MMNQLSRYLENIKDGFFIESGAYDGIFQSNTKWLEDIGWNGLLIEPSVASYVACKSNRKSKCINCALVSSDYKSSKIEGNFKIGHPCCAVNDIPEYFTQHEINETVDKMNNLLAIDARTIQSIIDEEQISKIDFWSLDVEGYEIKVLDGMDFSKIRPKYILIEVSDFRREHMRNYMAAREYAVVEQMNNNNDLFMDMKC